jgi:hypothetical protein
MDTNKIITTVETEIDFMGKPPQVSASELSSVTEKTNSREFPLRPPVTPSILEGYSSLMP